MTLISNTLIAAIVIALLSAALPSIAQEADAGKVAIPPKLPVETFAKLPWYEQLQLSPDAKHMAMLGPIEGRRHVIIHPTEGANEDNLVVLPPVNKADIMWFRWANANRLLVAYEFTATYHLGEKTTETRLMAVDRNGENWVNVVGRKDKETGFSQLQTNIIDMLWDDPDHILMVVQDARYGPHVVRRYNVNTGAKYRVQLGRDGVQNWMVDRDGVPRLGWGYMRTSKVMIYRAPGESEFKKATNSQWYDAGYEPLTFTDDPQMVFARGPVRGREGLVVLNLTTGELYNEMFASDAYDIDGVIMDHKGRRVIGVRYTEHQPKVQYFDASYERLQNRIDELLPNTTNRIVQSLPDRNMHLIHQSSDREAGVFLILDLNTANITPIARMRSDLAAEQMAHVTAVTYDARDGLEIPAYLTVPLGREAKNLPTVVLPHGGPWTRDTKAFDYWSQFLANRGYAVLRPNFRGSTGYGLEFQNRGIREFGGKMVEDVIDGTKWLIEQGVSDPARICIAGWSYGGYSALMNVVLEPDMYQCAASVNGVANLPALMAHDRGFIGGRNWIKEMQTQGEKTKDVSPHHQVAKIKVPVLMVAAKDDTRVPYRQSKAMHRKTKAIAGSKYVQLKTGGHSLDNEAGRLAMLKALETFLEEHLGPGA